MSDNITSIERDIRSRNRIVSEIGQNFFVEAGAGSGKTTMLVNRMVAMVEEGIDIRKICAITFTKAAAGEFYDRFQKLLIERSNPDYEWVDNGFAGQLKKTDDMTRARCESALQNIDLCFMGTIDSFCSMVLSEHPSEAGIPSDADIMTEEDAADMYKQIYVRICAGAYGPELMQLARSFRALHRNAQDVFVEGEAVFMENRNVHFNFKEVNAVDVDQMFSSEKKSILRALKCLEAHPELKYDKNQKSVAAWEKLPNVINSLKGKWSNNFPRVISGLNALKEIKVLSIGLEKYAAELEACFEAGGKKGAWLEFTPAKEGGVAQRMNDMRYDISMIFLQKCVPVLEKVMKDKGCMTFFDYLYYLRNMLKKDACGDGRLIRYIYDRHSYFLIDEFQDTNPMQAEIFFYLTSEHPVDQWSLCLPRPGSLFIVGDPKQSIYRFRSADVTSFLKVKDLFAHQVGEILYLSQNFRSIKGLCGYFNRIFSEMLPVETKVQSKFEEIPIPDNDRDEFKGVYKYTAYTGKLEEVYPDQTDPLQIRNIITTLVGNESYNITAGNEEPRPIRYGDIMIISKGKANIDPIMKALADASIPMKVEGKVPFDRNAALEEICNIYAAVADPADQAALYRALQGGFFRLSDEDLMAFRNAGGYLSLDYYQAETAEETKTDKVADILASLKELAYRAGKLSPAALFSEIMDSYRVYTVAEADNIEVIYYTLELLRNAEKSGEVVTLKDGAAYLEKLLSGEADEERCLSLNEKKDCVHIANLHKVKGLEAPIIILAASAPPRATPSFRIVHGDMESEGYIFALNNRQSNSWNSPPYFSTEVYEDEKADETEAEKAEHARLIYVAATRARNALIICNRVQKIGKSEGVKSMWTPLVDAGTEDIFEYTKDSVITTKSIEAEEVEAEMLYEKAGEDSALCDRSPETRSYELKNPSRTKLVSKFADEIASEEEQQEEAQQEEAGKEERERVNGAHKYPTILGTMVHKLMEIMVITKNSLNVNELISEILREFLEEKYASGEKVLKEALQSVAYVMQNGGYRQVNHAPQDILQVLLDAEEVHCEVPFCYKESTEGTEVIWNGVMDVLYKDKKGWHIVDYKTNQDGSHLDEKYKRQLEAYEKAFKEIRGEEAEAMIYHMDI